MDDLTVVLAARASQFFSTMGKAQAEITKLSAKGGSDLKKWQTLGKAAFIGVAGGAVAMGVASLRAAGNFQVAMTRLVTGAQEPERNIKALSKGIEGLAQTTGYSVEQLAAGMYQIASAGFHGAQGLNVLHAAAEGARAGNADMATVANALTSIMNAYHLSAGKAVNVTNALIATEGSGKITMEDLAGSIGKVASAAATVGVPLNQVLGAMSTMTMTGTDAASASTYLRQTILQLSNPLPKAQKEMEGLGLSSIDVAKNLGKRGLVGTLQLLTDAIAKKMGPNGVVFIQSLQKMAKHTTDFQKVLAKLPSAEQTQVAALANMVGGTKSMQAALQLTGANMATFAKNSKTVGDALQHGGKNVKDWGLVQKNLNLQLADAKNAIINMAINLGTVLIPVVSKMIKVTADAFGWLKKHKDMALALGAVIGGYLTIAMAVYAAHLAQTAKKTVMEFGGMNKAAFKYFTDSEQGGRKAITSLANMSRASAKWVATQAANLAKATARFAVFVAESIAKAAVWVAGQVAAAVTTAAAMVASAAATAAAWVAANIAMIAATGGIILLLAALAAGAYELYKHWDQVWGFIKAIVKDAWDWIKKHVDLIIAVALGPLGIAVLELYKHWGTVWNGIKAVVKDVWDFLRPIFEDIKRGVEDVTGAISKVAGIGGGALGAVAKVGSFFKGMFAEGGFVPGTGSSGVPIIAHPGELILNQAQQGNVAAGLVGASGEVGGGDVTVHVYLDGRQIFTSLQTQALRTNMRNGSNRLALT